MRRIRLLGHPIHPITVHAPIGLFTGTVFSDLLSWVTASHLWTEVAYWTLVLGLGSSVLTLITGFLDYAALPAEPAIEETASRHLMAALIGLTLFGASLLVRSTVVVSPQSDPLIAAALSLTAMAVIGLTGWLGGELVYRHRVGAVQESSSSKASVD